MPTLAPSPLLKLPSYKILMGKPSTRPIPELRGHPSDKGVSPFAFQEGPA